MGTHKRKNKPKMFIFTHENMEPLFNQIFSELANVPNNKNGYRSTSQKSSKWCSCMNLSSIPTKAEDLHVKVDEKSRILVVSGKSETESTRRDGEDLFHSCLDEGNTHSRRCRAEYNRVEAEREQAQNEEDNHQEIPIEIVDTPALY